MINPFEFIQQVRSEGSKVVWPTRRETLVTTGLVLLLVVFASLFFTTVDTVLREVVALRARLRPQRRLGKSFSACNAAGAPPT